MENKEERLNTIKEVVESFYVLKEKLSIKIEEYLIDILRKFNDDFIEFDNCQSELRHYEYNGSIKTLTAISLDYYNSTYVKLNFEDEYGNTSEAMLFEMTISQQMSIIDDVENYIKKYGYKNSNDIN